MAAVSFQGNNSTQHNSRISKRHQSLCGGNNLLSKCFAELANNVSAKFKLLLGLRLYIILSLNGYAIKRMWYYNNLHKESTSYYISLLPQQNMLFPTSNQNSFFQLPHNYAVQLFALSTFHKRRTA